MNIRYSDIYFILFLFLLTYSNAQKFDNWSVTLNAFLKNCATSTKSTNNQQLKFLDIVRVCLKKRALKAVDAILSDNVIPIINGIELIRFKAARNSSADVNGDKSRMIKSTNDDSENSWREIIFQRFTSIFNTHVLKIDMQRLTNRGAEENYENDNSVDSGIVEGRRRHRKRHNLMPMMMMGLLIMGSVLIPMGFQFLAVLGGKALLLAKLALMLSSIQGLKKIATSGVNYGLYHHGPPVDGWHDRSHQDPILQYGVPYNTY